MKPDICAFFDWIRTTNPGDEYTSQGSGTSIATPVVAGHLGLIQQLWHRGVFGNPVAPGSVFENRAPASTVKALLLNSSKPYPLPPPIEQPHDIVREAQGWGVPDMNRLYRFAGQSLVVAETVALKHLQSKTWVVEIAPGVDDFRATLAFSDYPGSECAGKHHVNNLSLRVLAPDGQEYWGNQGMRTANLTRPGGTSDGINSVEQVWLAQPLTSTWRIQVLAENLQVDAIPSTPELDAVFSLVVTPVLRVESTDPLHLEGPSESRIGHSFQLQWSEAEAFAPWWLLVSDSNRGSQVQNLFLDVGPAVQRLAGGLCDGQGKGSQTLGPAAASLLGRSLHFELLSRLSFGWTESNLQTVAFVP